MVYQTNILVHCHPMTFFKDIKFEFRRTYLSIGNVVLTFLFTMLNLQPHPDVKPMAYANNFLRMFS